MTETVTAMLAKAQAAMARAYVPYSNFHVGACIRTNSGEFSGCNYENVSYPLGQCAESVAIGAMIAAGVTQILEMVIIGESDLPCTPCGACRQRIREFAALDTLVHMFSKTGDHITMTVDELLPNSFGPEYLSRQ